MDFLLALVSPALFPALERVLEVAFLTGFAHSWKLQATQKGQPNKALPSLTRRKRPARKFTLPHSGDALPKAPPNDPQRQGNIWHRYEQLENVTKSLAGVNQQMVMEKAKHQREKRRYEEAMLELQRVNEALLIAAQQDDTSGKNTAKAQYSISADSAQLLGELRNRPRSYCPVSGLERPTVPLLPQPAPETCSLQDKRQGEDATEHAQAMARLQGQLAAAQDRAKKTDEEAARLRAAVKQLQDELSSQTALLHSQVESLEEANAQLEAKLKEKQAEDLGHSLETQVLALAAENEELRSLTPREKGHMQPDDLADTTRELQAKIVELDKDLQTLKEENRRLAVQKADLEAAQRSSPKGTASAQRIRELEDAHAATVAENARLQAKIMRLSGTVPAVEAAGELLQQLKAENAALQSDNERLLNYVDTINAVNSGGLNSGTPRGHRKLLESFVQLKSDNKLLAEENARLEAELAEVQHVRGGITTVPVPVRVENGEEVDRELWVLLEELQERNQSLAAENTALRARPPTGSWPLSEAELASENERLQRQLSAVMEMRAAEINDDNLRLVNHLTEENWRLEEENARLSSCLAAAAKGGDLIALQDLLANLARLQSGKSKVMAENAELARKNTRLIEESEAMLSKFNGGGEATGPAGSRQPRRSFFSFRRSPSKSVLPLPLSEAEKQAGDSPHSQVSSHSACDGAARLPGTPQSGSLGSPVSPLPGSPKLGSLGSETELLSAENGRLLSENARLTAENLRLAEQANVVEDLTNTNAHLTAENARLNDRMAKLVKDLTEENKQLLDENQCLNATVKKMLEENAELTSRLIDVALTSSHVDVFDVAFGGEGTPQGSQLARLPLGHWSPEEVQRRHREANEELLAVGRQQAMRAQHRVELSRRASTELEAYESAKRSAEQAYSKSKALALQRLQSRNSQAAQSVAGAPPAAARHLGPPGPPTPEPADRSAPNENGQFDEALRRRREAELSRAQLQQKIEAFKRRRGREDPAMGDPPDGSGGRGTPANGSAEQTKAAAARARAEAAHRREMQRKDAEDRVRAAYFRYAGNHDVAAFMRALGFEMPAQPSSRREPSSLELARRAMQVLQSEIQRDAPRDQQFLVEAVIHRLQQWSTEMQA